LVGVEVGLEGQEQLAELLALVGVEGGEELVLGGVLGVGTSTLGSTPMIWPSSCWPVGPWSWSRPSRWNWRGLRWWAVWASRSRRMAVWPSRANSSPALVRRCSMMPLVVCSFVVTLTI
jgi:hypothetical protein